MTEDYLSGKECGVLEFFCYFFYRGELPDNDTVPVSVRQSAAKTTTRAGPGLQKKPMPKMVFYPGDFVTIGTYFLPN
jgi:hypothetical protein